MSNMKIVLIEDRPKVKGSNRDGGSTVMCLEAVDASNVSLSAMHHFYTI